MPEITARLSTDRYRIERRLGEGGMATVYLAEDLNQVHRSFDVATDDRAGGDCYRAVCVFDFGGCRCG